MMPQQKSSVYATEGTAAHELAELMARDQILGMVGHDKTKALRTWRKKYAITDEAEAEMMEHAQGYVDFLERRMTEVAAVSGEAAILLLEQRLPTGITDSWGISDAIIVSTTSVDSIDYKYGLGVRVEAVGNPQLRLYGVGALETYGDLLGDVEIVRLTVYQPRLGHVASEELSATALRQWRDSLIPVAQQALGPDAPFGPGEDTCRWCPASGSCLAQMEWATARDFGVKSEMMSDDELAKALDDIPGIKSWCTQVEAYALNRAYSDGKPIPGYKVVMSGGKRQVTDPEGLITAAVAVGYAKEAVSVTKAKGIGELEKLLKEDFDTVAGPFVAKSTGSPSLVPESDKRQAIDPEAQAAKDFG